MSAKRTTKRTMSELLDIMARLRDPKDGCPWDLAQDFRSIAPYTIEEAYEVADAIERDAIGELPDELGDLLFHVVFHAQIGADRGAFDFADVVEHICDKMIRRHPHVFADAIAENDAVVAENWETIKRQEQPDGDSVLDGIALGLPALTRAAKLGKRASSVGFDWRDLAGVRAKIDEELAEIDAVGPDDDPARIESEVGDLLFSVVNYCRHVGIDPERSLRGANERFSRRFRRVEADVAAQGGDWDRFGEAGLDALWRKAKAADTD